jgi:hypothetical protein
MTCIQSEQLVTLLYLLADPPPTSSWWATPAPAAPPACAATARSSRWRWRTASPLGVAPAGASADERGPSPPGTRWSRSPTASWNGAARTITDGQARVARAVTALVGVRLAEALPVLVAEVGDPSRDDDVAVIAPATRRPTKRHCHRRRPLRREGRPRGKLQPTFHVRVLVSDGWRRRMQNTRRAGVGMGDRSHRRDVEFAEYMHSPVRRGCCARVPADRRPAQCRGPGADVAREAVPAWDKVHDRGSMDGYVRRIMVNENNSLWRRAWKKREFATRDDARAHQVVDEYDEGSPRARCGTSSRPCPGRRGRSSSCATTSS